MVKHAKLGTCLTAEAVCCGDSVRLCCASWAISRSEVHEGWEAEALTPSAH